MPYKLRESLRYCVVGDSTVFLDLESGRYAALPDPFASSFGRWASGDNLTPSDLRTLDRLAEQGFLVVATTVVAVRSSAAAIAAPEAALDTNGCKPTISSLLAALAARLRWSSRVRRWTIDRLIRQIGEGQCEMVAEVSPMSLATLKRLVRSFEIVDALFGSHDQCLARSLALTAACRRHGIASNLVIGVRPAPFAAHSWVQQGQIVLNEKPDRALLFTPILVA